MVANRSHMIITKAHILADVHLAAKDRARRCHQETSDGKDHTAVHFSQRYTFQLRLPFHRLAAARGSAWCSAVHAAWQWNLSSSSSSSSSSSMPRTQFAQEPEPTTKHDIEGARGLVNAVVIALAMLGNCITAIGPATSITPVAVFLVDWACERARTVSFRSALKRNDIVEPVHETAAGKRRRNAVVDGSAAAAGAGEVAEDITYLHVQLSVMAKSQSESLPLQQDAMPWI
eukprot:COSAG01_NODE_5848_length_3996_cov_37.085964_6_plen_231_part_00